MNVMAPAQPSFEEARRRHLIEATVEAVADVGFKAASLSQIARRANVSTGLYAHYFHDKDGLLEATLRFLAARLAIALRERLKAATTPRERLLAVVDAALGDQEFDRRTSAVWLAFWGQIAHSDRFQRIQYAYQRRLHTNLRHAFRTCVPADRAEPCATIVAGLIDGLWLQSHAYKGGATADQARSTVHQVVFMLIESSRSSDNASASPAAPAVDHPRVRRDDADRMLAERARHAAGLWTASSPRDRAAALRLCSRLVAEHGPSLARLDAAATGRPVLTEVEFFIPRCVDAFEEAAERAHAGTYVRHELGDGVTAIEICTSPSVVFAKAHRNAPLLDLCRSIGDALGGGGALVVDMPCAARSVATEIEALLGEAGVPRGLVAIRCTDESEADDVAAPSAAIVLKGADVARAIETVLTARDPSRRTPDLSEIVVFVDKAVLRATETAAIGWCKRAAAAMNPACGSARSGGASAAQAVAASLATGATLVYGRGQAGEATILRRRDAEASAGLFAPILRVVAFDNDKALLAMLDRTSFDSIAIFSGEDRRAEQIARAAPTAVYTLNAYDLACESARELLRDWAPSGLRRSAPKRLLTFTDARA